MKAFVIWLPRASMEFGWGNGYVAIPKGHPFHGLDYDTLNEKGIEVNGGLTYSQYATALPDPIQKGNDLNPEDWVVGFDTAHFGDTLEKWPKVKVEEEAERLKTQLEALSLIKEEEG